MNTRDTQISVDVVENVESVKATLLNLAKLIVHGNVGKAVVISSGVADAILNAYEMLDDYASVLRIATSCDESDPAVNEKSEPTADSRTTRNRNKPFSDKMLGAISDFSLAGGEFHFRLPRNPVADTDPTGSVHSVKGRSAASDEKVQGVPQFVYQYKLIGVNADFKICTQREYEYWKTQQGARLRKLKATYMLVEQRNCR